MIEIHEVRTTVAKKFGLGNCYRAWQMYDDGRLVVTGGVVKKTLTGEAEVWLVPEGPWSLRLLKVFHWCRDELGRRFGRMVAHVDPEKEKDKRFAEFFGFKLVGQDWDKDGKAWLRYEN